jgi:hypothetical protein
MEAANPQEELESEDDEEIMEQVQRNLAMISALRTEICELKAEADAQEPVHSFAPVARRQSEPDEVDDVAASEAEKATAVAAGEAECATELMQILDSCDSEDVENLVEMALGLLQSRDARLRLHLPTLIAKMPQILTEATQRGLSLPEEEAVSLVSEVAKNKPLAEKILKSGLVDDLEPEGLCLLLMDAPQLQKKVLSKQRLQGLSELQIVALSKLGGESVCNDVLRRQMVRDRLSNTSMKELFSTYPNLLPDYRFQLRADQLSSHDVMAITCNNANYAK